MNPNLIAPEVIQRFAGSLLHFIWQGAVIAMITAAGLRMLRRGYARLPPGDRQFADSVFVDLVER